MTLYTITTTTTTQRTLGSGDDVYIAQTGAIAYDGYGGAVSAGPQDTIADSIIGIDGAIFSTGQGVVITDGEHTSVMIGATGSINSGREAFSIVSNGSFVLLKVSNAGQINAGNAGVAAQGTSANPNVLSTLDNSGTILGGYQGVFIDSGASYTRLFNSGTIAGAQTYGVRLLGTGDKSVDNSGTIQGEQTGLGISEGGAATVANSGLIRGKEKGIDTDGALTLVNSGEITGTTDNAIAALSTLDLRNSGEINGPGIAIYAASYTSIRNTGTIIGDVHIDSTGEDSVKNTGQVVGYVQLGAGDDVYLGKRGLVTDGVFGGDGADRLAGGSDEDGLYGGADADVLRGRAGDDDIVGGGGADRMWGGRDRDSFVFQSATDAGTKAAADVIFDFQSGDDRIDLEALNLARFIGAKGFSGNKAEVRVKELKALTLVQIDADGDGAVDMEIRLLGAKAVGADDFLI